MARLISLASCLVAMSVAGLAIYDYAYERGRKDGRCDIIATAEPDLTWNTGNIGERPLVTLDREACIARYRLP